MKQIPTNEIEDGMTLARDAMTPDGQVLLGSGTVLNDKYKQVLLKRNVEKVAIVEENEEFPADEIKAETGENVDGGNPELEKRIGAIEHAFEPVLDKPLMTMVRDCAIAVVKEEGAA